MDQQGETNFKHIDLVRDGPERKDSQKTRSQGNEEGTTNQLHKNNQRNTTKNNQQEKPNKALKETKTDTTYKGKTTQEERFSESFGDTMGKKEEKTIRIATLNIRSFPLEKKDSSKYDMLKEEIIRSESDIIGFTELNHNWQQIHENEQLHKQTRNWWRNKTIQKSWLKTDNRRAWQQGGTATIATNRMTSHVQKRGEDPRQLGRWSWITLCDTTKGIYTTIITLYFPCTNIGTYTVYSQQLEKIRETMPKYTGNATELYHEDLENFVKEKTENNHQIVIMGDFNQDMNKTTRLTRMLRKYNIHDVIKKRHGRMTTTYEYGTNPIDSILCSDTISIKSGGHLQGTATSDHKLVWVEIHEEDILGNTTPCIRPHQRKLQADHPKIRKKYNKALEKQLQKNGVGKIIKQLKQEMKNEKKEQYAKTYEKLDGIRRRAITHAEKICMKEKTGQVPFSPAIKTAIGEIVMWKLLYKRATSTDKYKPRYTMLRRKAKHWEFDIEKISTTTAEEIKIALHKAERYYKIIRKNAKELRTSYLEKKAEAMEEEQGGNRRNYLKQLQHTEDIREMHNRIRSSQKPNTNAALNYVEEGEDEGPRTTITEKEAMETAIRIANMEKLMQSNNTPLREEPLKSTFKEDELNFDTWEKILDPSVPLPTDLERGTKLWFQQMRNKETTLPKTKITFNAETYKTSWKKMKERTSSHPGIHFGHMKAIDKHSPVAAKVHAILSDIPLQTGYSPKAWKECTNAMLQKKSHDIRPSKLRLITLLDTTFNHNNKIIGKTIMQNGEKHGAIAPEQYGSRKRKSAIEHALNKVLTLDVSRQTRENLIFIGNDAVSCYDRIVLMAAYCSMIKFGITKQAAQSMISTLATMEHYIRTGKGDSVKSYGGKTWVRLPHGIGQGNGAGPAIWICVSTPLFNALREEGFGMKIRSPLSLVLLHITGFAFVDDADLVQGQEDLETEEELLHKAQNQLLVWEQLLRTTGGAIEPTKSHWVFVRYEWKHGQWKYKKGKYKEPLYVRNKQKEYQKLTQLEVHEARETLGVYIAANGNWKEQAIQLTRKAKQWGDKLRKGYLNPGDAMLALQTTITKSLEYCLPATTLTKKQCTDIIKPLLASALPKMNISRNINRQAVHLPKQYNGIGIIDLHMQQGISHIKILLQHGGHETTTGQLLQASLELLLLEIGSFHDLNELPTTLLKNSTQSWIKHTLLFAQENSIKLEQYNTEFQKWTNNEYSIMDEIIRTNKFNKDELQQINNCRQHMEVLTVSDITTEQGYLLREARDIKEYESLSSTRYAWPAQPQPLTEEAQMWRTALHAIGLRTHQPNTRYEYSLTTTDAAYVAQWRHDQITDTLWRKEGDNWEQWVSTNDRSRKQKYINRHRLQDHSCTEWKIAIPLVLDDTAELITTMTNSSPHIDRGEPGRYETWIQTPTIAEGPALDNFLAQIMDGTAGCISDGSQKDHLASAGYKSMHSTHEEPAIQGAQKIPGRLEDQTSYRAELAGLLILITTINYLCHSHNIHKGKITIACDNQSALTSAFAHNHIHTKSKSRDILQAIYLQRKITNITWNAKHVHGHQDDKKDELTEWEQANVDCDHFAEQARTDNSPAPEHIPLAGEKWRLVLGHHVITGHIEKALETHCFQPTALSYWTQRGRFTKDHQNHINWKGVQKATTMLTPRKNVFLTKFYSGFHCTAKVMKRRREWATSECPLCHTDEEDHEHVLQCRSITTTDNFTDAYGKLEEWITKTSSTDIAEAIWVLISDYRDKDASNIIYPHWPDTVREAVVVQRQLGPRSFIEGIHATHWVRAQQQHFTERNKTQHSADIWAARLVARIWTFTHDMWKGRCTAIHTNKIQSAMKHNDHALQLHDLLARPPPTSMPAHDRKHFVPLQVALTYNHHRQKSLIRQLTTFTKAHNERINTPSAQCMNNWLSTFHPD